MMKSVNSQQEQLHVNGDGLTLGQQLRAAREALNLSIADVALKTNLKKSHIESLENDIFILKNVAPTFVRGYVRNYVKFLRLPEVLISSVNYGEVTIPKEVTKVSPVKPSPNSQGRSLKYLTILVLLAALGMTLLWWWQGYQKDQENREQLVNSAPINVEAVGALNETAATTQSIPVQQPIVPATTSEIAPATTEPALTEKVEVVAPTEVKPSLDEVSAATEATQSETVNILQNTQTEGTQTQATEQQQTAIGNDELRIEITGSQSWITVRGTKNKRLAEKLYSNGETLTFNDNEQYRLTIGAPANVKLYYKGQEVPLKIDGRVARIRLPLQ
ncbi:RodZ domain-containing protein [Mannheimia granulomatis]|uniref:RodZ domain-containing protein n=1 Tax=Mannheimia granulomatis TaxID=85402 RepID=UPI00047ADE8B|nr:RodZ domain-containing protein [Mannheimia granulomatis]QLB19449.1 DNA-binding protein [Mannheimia granulomatis]